MNKVKIIANGSSNGINVNYFNPKIYSLEFVEKLKSKLKINKDDFIYLYVGRIVSDKGINELLEVFDNISKSNANITLLLVGFLESGLDPFWINQ